MALKMTANEYQEKYGSLPERTTPSGEKKQLPIKMTRKEYETKYIKNKAIEESLAKAQEYQAEADRIQTPLGMAKTIFSTDGGMLLLFTILLFLVIFRKKLVKALKNLKKTIIRMRHDPNSFFRNTKKLLRVTLALGALIVAFSILYSFVYRPYQREESTRYCHRWADDKTRSSYRAQELYKEKFDWCMNEQGR